MKRWINAIAFVTAAVLVVGCGSKRPPIDPPKPPTAGWLKLLVIDDETGRPIVDARVDVQPIDGIDDGRTNGDGRKDLYIPHGIWAAEIHADGYRMWGRDVNFLPDRPDYTDGIVVRLEPNPRHVDPVVGRLTVDPARGCLADQNGCRTGAIAHMGDLFARYVAGRQRNDLAQIETVKQNIRDAQSEGYIVLRTWFVLNWWLTPGNVWYCAAYPGVSEQSPGYEDYGVELIELVAAHGMRLTVIGGVADGSSRADERRQFEALERIISRAGADNVAWFEAANEITSAGCADRDGDEDPDYLRSLTRIVTDRHPGLLWFLSHGNNESWDDAGNWTSQKRYTHRDQLAGYYHPWRGGLTRDKVRHEFSWRYEDPGHYKKLWFSGEGMGAPTEPGVPGDPLTRVSATANGHEMNDPEALAAIVAMGSLRGMGSHMSGTGVRFYLPFPQSVGWREIPWTVRQLPRDVHTFDRIHHGGDSFRGVRVLQAHGEVRVDGVIDPDGQFAYLIYGPAGSYNIPVDKSFSGRLCDSSAMQCQDVSAQAGGTFPVSFRHFRLLVGRVQ